MRRQVLPADQRASSATSARSLDWFTFFLADIQTGFGPFVAVYLTAHAWTQFDIGLVLTAGGLAALAGQMPGGALVDAMRSARL
ncbi:MAG TPA: MFS transporter, partial [Xanthobacteraceae bacterium]